MRIYKFDDVIGNSATMHMLRSSLKNNNFPKFAIMAGTHGTGKSTSAVISALTLTCPNPVNGQACLKCKTCLENIKAMETSGRSKNIVKLNLGKLNSKTDVSDIIKEIFVLESPIGNNVYILEEVHCWDPKAQTALLEEIDRIGGNTYIILNTTKKTALIKELRSRAITFNFNELGSNEASLLFDRACLKMGIRSDTSKVKSMILNYARGIPRDIVNLIDFIFKTSPSPKEVAEFLGVINADDFISLFQSMSEGLGVAIVDIENLIHSHAIDMLTEHLKGFIIDVLFTVEGCKTTNFTPKQRKSLLQLITPSIAYKVCRLIENIDSSTISENDFRLLMIRMTQVLQKKNISDIYKDNAQNASAQQVVSNELNKEREVMKHEAQSAKDTKLTNNLILERYKVVGNKDSLNKLDVFGNKE